MTQRPKNREVLRRGELTVLGRIRSASNATFLCEATLDDHTVHCVYKPVAGEQPLWDFPDGTLAGRELSAYLVSTHLGWNIVPHTIIRHGPAGPGMLQIWVDQPGDAPDSDPGPELDLVDLVPADRLPPGYLPVLRAYDYAGEPVSLVHADDLRLWRMAVFDVLVNNADRKGGHVLRGVDGDVDTTLAKVSCLVDALAGSLGDALADHITSAEIAALRLRARALLDNPVMPGPDRHRPVPWPAF
jgi:uncharacterized repeat protein (TIGR03843 family)